MRSFIESTRRAFQLDENARHYRSYSIVRCAEEVLEQAGMRTRHLGKSDIIGIALGLDQRVGYHTTSDFPTILVGGREQDAPPAIRAPRADMDRRSRAGSRFRISVRSGRQFRRSAALKKVLEHGEYTRGTIGEGKEQMQLATYGRIFAVTRQVLVNDDLEIFGRMAAFWARSARNLEYDLVWSEILRNALMADGFALFSTQHANLAAPGTIHLDRVARRRRAPRWRDRRRRTAGICRLSGATCSSRPGSKPSRTNTRRQSPRERRARSIRSRVGSSSFPNRASKAESSPRTRAARRFPAIRSRGTRRRRSTKSK